MFSSPDRGIENLLDISLKMAFEGLGKTTFERISGILTKKLSTRIKCVLSQIVLVITKF